MPDRRRPRRFSPFVVVTAVGLLAIASMLLVHWYDGCHARLTFDASGGAVPALDLSFFPQQLAFGAPSPPPPLGELHLDASGSSSSSSVSVGDELVPQQGVVRYRGDGIGAGFAVVRVGEQLTIPMRKPAAIEGRVGRPEKVWCFGWRTVAMRAIAGAEVLLMGGGQHGVDLASAVTGEDGSFVVSGFDGQLDALGLRVRAPGYVIADTRLEDLDRGADGRPLIVLEPAPPRRGRLLLDLPPDHKLRAEHLRVLARGLPGAEAVPAADGTFVLHHVPADVEARLLLYGLPADCATAEVRTSRDVAVQVRVVQGAILRGQVLSSVDLQPVPGAFVWVGEQEAVRCDRKGRYELQHVLAGSVAVRAQWQPSNAGRSGKQQLGARHIDVKPGQLLERVDIVLEK